MEITASAKIRYLNHSGFSVETAEHFLVFDYFPASPEEWAHPEGKAEEGLIDPAAFPEKSVFVFASHSHPDHFDRRILGWRKKAPRAHYVLSEDIRLRDPSEGALVLGAGKTVLTDEVEIRTLRSTDQGVAFLVKTDGLCLYHAGDLNWWHWEGEPDADNEEMGRKYRREIDSLRGEKIDLAFVPTDPRLEKSYLLGLDYFMKTADARMVFPMHFWGDFGVCARIRASKEAAAYRDRVVSIEKRGQLFLYPDYLSNTSIQ